MTIEPTDCMTCLCNRRHDNCRAVVEQTGVRVHGMIHVVSGWVQYRHAQYGLTLCGLEISTDDDSRDD
jgi:hypothetical protein